MNIQDRTLALSRAYALLSDIFLHGITDANLPVINALPGMPHLDSDSLDEYAAQHYDLFGRNVYPYAAVFLDRDGFLGGAVTEAASALYAQFGYGPPTSESPDHIAVELNALAFLTGAEVDPDHSQHVRQLQRRFLDEHLLRWLPAFVFSAQQLASGIYDALVQQTLALVFNHRQQLGDNLMAGEPFVLPTPPDLIHHEKTSLKDIAHYLLTPAYTGFFLSQETITQLGGALRLPHGFGKREQTLTNLLRESADYGLFDSLMAEFKNFTELWRQFYDDQADLPSPIRAVWIERLTRTRRMLTELRQMAGL